jgi:hypothetical protein
MWLCFDDEKRGGRHVDVDAELFERGEERTGHRHLRIFFFEVVEREVWMKREGV